MQPAQALSWTGVPACPSLSCPRPLWPGSLPPGSSPRLGLGSPGYTPPSSMMLPSGRCVHHPGGGLRFWPHFTSPASLRGTKGPPRWPGGTLRRVQPHPNSGLMRKVLGRSGAPLDRQLLRGQNAQASVPVMRKLRDSGRPANTLSLSLCVSVLPLATTPLPGS